MDRTPRIPRLVTRILDWVEPSLIGDIVEEYREFVVPVRGPVRARLWFWMHIGKAVVKGVLGGLRIPRIAGVTVPDVPVAERKKSVGENMKTWLNDVRFAFRMVRKSPGISVTAIVVIALGVGVTTHTFSLVYGAAIRGLPYEGADRLMHLERARLAMGVTSMGVPIHDFIDWRDQQTVFEDLAAFYQGTVNLSDDDGQPERYAGAFVTTNALQQVGVEPVLGRFFREGEDQAGVPLTAMIGYRVWQDRFSGVGDVLGKSVRVNGRPATIIGVMPEGYRFPFEEDIWLPLDFTVSDVTRGSGIQLEIIGKLKPGTTRDEAFVQMSAIAARLAAAYPESNEGVTPIVQPYVDEYMPSQITQILYLMLAAVFGVLLIACANVANLFLARAAVRTKEVAVRTALGAKRFAIIRQLVLESTVLAFLGGIFGVAMSHTTVRLFNNWVADIQKPYWIDMRLDTTVLIFALIVTALAGLISGTIPAFKATSSSLNHILQDESRGSSGFKVGRLSSILVVAEIAVSCALLVAAGLMVKSVATLRSLDMGFEKENILTARVGLFETDYPERADRLRFFDQLLPRLQAIPGVQTAAFTTELPGTDTDILRFGVEGEAYLQDRDYPTANVTITTPEFFDVFGVSLLDGALYDASNREDGLNVVLVNQSFAERFLAGDSPLGRRIRFGTSGATGPWRSVVGVVPDLWVGAGAGGIGASSVQTEHIYVPFHQANVSFPAMALRTAGGPETVVPEIRRAVAELDPDLPVYNILPMTSVVEQSTWSFGVFGSLFTMFGIIALVLAAVGLYGVMAFTVSNRTKEMGIRMAMGAVGHDIVRLVLRKGLTQLGVGLAIGIGMGLAMSRALNQILFGVSPDDPFVYGAIIVTLLGTGLLACLIPARRATRVNLVDALRPD